MGEDIQIDMDYEEDVDFRTASNQANSWFNEYQEVNAIIGTFYNQNVSERFIPIYDFMKRALGIDTIDPQKLGTILDERCFIISKYKELRKDLEPKDLLPYWGIDPVAVGQCEKDIIKFADFYLASRGYELDSEDQEIVERIKGLTSKRKDAFENKKYASLGLSDKGLIKAVVGSIRKVSDIQVCSRYVFPEFVRHYLKEESKVKHVAMLRRNQLKPDIKSVLSFEDAERLQAIDLHMPNLDAIESFNEAVLSGERIYIFCCPNYSTETTEDGRKKYSFDSLGENIGLTAERTFPLMFDLINNMSTREINTNTENPIRLRIGIADFEATEGNAERVGLTVSEFETRLGKSIEAMIDTIIENIDLNSFEINIDYLDDDDAIRESVIKIVDKQYGRVVAEVSLGRVTTSFVSEISAIPDYSKETFNELVETSRVALMHAADVNQNFQNTLDLLMSVRLNLILNWAANEGINAPKDLAIGDTIKDRRDFILEVNARAVRGDRECQNFITHARRWLARQGAEYFVMNNLIGMSGQNSAHIVGDAINMWETFKDFEVGVEELAGVKKVKGRLFVDGGYEGSEGLEVDEGEAA